MSIFRYVVRSKGSVCQNACETFHNMCFFLQSGVNYSLALPLSWFTPCRLSAHLVYAQPPSISGTRLLRLQPEDAPCAGNRDTHLRFSVQFSPIPHKSIACMKVPKCRLRALLIKECCYVEGGYGALLEWYWRGKTKFLEKNLCLPHILPRFRTLASAARSLQLRTWAIARAPEA
jgi:hypothetical protein